MVDPLRYKLQGFSGILIPICSSLSAFFPLKYSDNEQRDVIIEIDQRISLRWDQQPQEGKGWRFGDIFCEKMFHEDEDFMLSEDSDWSWISSSGHL